MLGSLMKRRVLKTPVDVAEIENIQVSRKKDFLENMTVVGKARRWLPMSLIFPPKLYQAG